MMYCMIAHPRALSAFLSLAFFNLYQKFPFLPDSVTTIHRRAFANCRLLAGLEIPASVTAIKDGAFYGCSSLARIGIPPSVTSIGADAFEGCSSLKYCSIPKSIVRIGKEPVAQYFRLNIPTSAFGSMVTGNAAAVAEGTRTAAAAVPGTATATDPPPLLPQPPSASPRSTPSAVGTLRTANAESNNVANFDVPAGATIIEASSWSRWGVNAKKVITLRIPGTVTTIGEGAFDRCASLTELDIPDTVATIAKYLCPGGWELKTVTIPDHLFFRMRMHYGDMSYFKDAVALGMVLVKPTAWAPVAAANGEGREPAHLPAFSLLWAPDAVVARLAGQYKDYTTFAEVPRSMRAAPDATTWAGVQLWLWWSSPTGAGYTNREGACDDPRVVCKPRKLTLYTTTMAGWRAAKERRLPELDPTVWLMIFGWLQHDTKPAHSRANERAIKRAAKIGGEPLMPPAEPWPTVQHDPLLFLLQIKMTDVHSEKGVDTLLSVLPKDGVLSFFYGGNHFEQYCKVLYTAEEQVGTMVPRAPPALPGQDYEGVYACDNDARQLLGDANLIQFHTLETCAELISLGYDTDPWGPRGRPPPRGFFGSTAAKNAELEWILLLQQDTVDCGRLYFMVKRADLAAADFSNVQCIYQYD